MNQPVFVYGTLKRGGRFHHVMEGATFISNARIESNLFIMRDLAHYPVLQLVADGSGGAIVGELYSVPEDQMAVIDRCEGYPNFYKRNKFTVIGGTTYYDAWVYYMDDAARLAQAEIIDNGEWPVRSSQPAPTFGPSFTVEQGFFITTDWGEHFGPYKTLKSAIQAIPDLTDLLDVGVRTLTVGARLVNDNLSQEDMEDVNYQTTQP